MRSNQGSFFNNLSTKQTNALESLEADQNTVIMPPDRDSSIVILKKNDYNEECLKILCNRHFHEELKEDLVPCTKIDLKTLFRNSYMTTLSLKMNMTSDVSRVFLGRLVQISNPH